MLRGKKLKDEWKTAWIHFLNRQEVRDAQDKASLDIGDDAWKMCVDYDMKSVKSFCFFFDVATQNGSMKGIAKPDGHDYTKYLKYVSKDMRRAWSSLQPNETRTLFCLAYLRACKSHPRWFKDVLARKAAIAHGRGYVHGIFRTYSFLK